jgi:hypothetical protein
MPYNINFKSGITSLNNQQIIKRTKDEKLYFAKRNVQGAESDYCVRYKESKTAVIKKCPGKKIGRVNISRFQFPLAYVIPGPWF